MGRPTWQKHILLKLYPILQLHQKSKLVYRLFSKIRNWKFLWNIVRMTPMGGDYGLALPMDKVISINETLDSQGSIILPNQIVDYFIEKSKYRVIMNYCTCRHSMHCKHFPEHIGCIFLGEGALKINPMQGRLVSKEAALTHVKKAREAGLVHMIGRLWMDSQIHSTGPYSKFMTICNCCPCCCITGIFKFMPSSLTDRYPKLPGLEVKVTDRCKGCGKCKKICFGDFIQIIKKRAVIGDDCRGCGRCVAICPQNAIELTITDNNFFEKVVRQLNVIVDVE